MSNCELTANCTNEGTVRVRSGRRVGLACPSCALREWVHGYIFIMQGDQLARERMYLERQSHLIGLQELQNNLDAYIADAIEAALHQPYNVGEDESGFAVYEERLYSVEGRLLHWGQIVPDVRRVLAVCHCYDVNWAWRVCAALNDQAHGSTTDAVRVNHNHPLA